MKAGLRVGLETGGVESLYKETVIPLCSPLSTHGQETAHSPHRRRDLGVGLNTSLCTDPQFYSPIWLLESWLDYRANILQILDQRFPFGRAESQQRMSKTENSKISGVTGKERNCCAF